MSITLNLVAIVIVLCLVNGHNEENADFKPDSPQTTNFGEAKAPRFLLFDVNPGEGFNLRRDVYQRVAVLMHNLLKAEPWILVLPPWGPLYHWSHRELEQTRIPWSQFFDVPSLARFVPVMEFVDFLKLIPKPWLIDEVYYLQYYKEGWGGEWRERLDERECHTMEYRKYYYDEETDLWTGWFFGFANYNNDVRTKSFKCLSYQGKASFIKPFLLQNTTGRSVMIDRAETMMHDEFGSVDYWTARRSMVFAKHLQKIGDEFRETFLDSTDEADKTVRDDDWTKNKPKPGDAKGGPYLAVHLRRADFAISRWKDTPTLAQAADKISEILDQQKLKKVFISTDCRDPKEFEEVKDRLKDKYEVYRFVPSKDILENYMDGGVAIIDQWICAHASYFIGTRESTFSFRIQDEREILGFDPKTTFNSFCGQGVFEPRKEPENPDAYVEDYCRQPSHWGIKYP